MCTAKHRALVVLLLTIACLGCPRSADVPAAVRQANKLAEEWQPPAKDVPPDQLFPAEVAGYKHGGTDTNAKLPAFDFAHAGRHATYTSDGRRVELFVYTEISKETLDQLFKRVEDSFGAGGGPEAPGFSFGGHWDFRSTHGERYLFFPKGGWLVVTRSEKGVDPLPFVDGYLRGLTKLR